MHTWVRRGLRTTLVTGGLLMLGTGIASAAENVNPDQPPSPVDAGVSVPVDAGPNAVGTPVGQFATPSVRRNVGTSDVTNAVPTGGQANPLLRGNRAVGNVAVPVQLCGNAIAAGGDARAAAACSQVAGYQQPITTNGDDGTLAGNVVAINGTVPVQFTGNAVGLVGDAFAHSVARQSGTTGGDIRTSGDGSTLSGTIAALQWATPVQVGDNAIAGAGNASADSASESDGRSTGSLRTSGNNATGGGTIAGVPVGVPFQVDGNGISGIGNASSRSVSTSNATAGSTDAHRLGLWSHPMWAVTSGDPSTLSGNIAQPQVSGPVSLDDNAGGVVGNTSADSINNSTDSAGGQSATTGNGSTGSGNFVDAPVALPTSGAGNAVTGVGNAAARHSNHVSSTAGGETVTSGDNSTLSANSLNVPPAAAVDACGDALGAVGNAAGGCDNDVRSTAGGYNGTTGNNAVGSGNIGQLPLAVAPESFGTALGVVGNATSAADETKSVTSGGEPNSDDDNGTLTSNVVSAPTAVPAQVFGSALSAVGNASATTRGDTTTTAGGQARATGHKATGAGNIVFVPTSAPIQGFGDTGGLVGNGSSLTSSSTRSVAGGDANSTGAGGSASGNVLMLADNPVDQVFGNAVDVVGLGGTDTGNTLVSQAGGNVVTDGDDGSLAGNAVAVPDTVGNQLFGNAVDVGGTSFANGANDSIENTGGQVVSSGFGGTGAGNVLTTPVAVDPDLFGNAVSVLGRATGIAENESVIDNGGDSITDGSGPLTAHNLNEPLGADLDMFDTAIGPLGRATTLVEDDSAVYNGPITKYAGPVQAIPLGQAGSGISGVLPMAQDLFPRA